MTAAPVLFVTNLVPADRVGAFAALHARVPIELALFGGRSHHATGAVDDPGVPHRHVRQRDVHALAASGRYGAVVCGTAGRVALPAAYTGARRARVPFVLWSALWAHLRTPAHLAARPLLDHVHRHADHVVTYGEHVSAFARARGARAVTVAPQAVDNAFWAAAAGPPAAAPFACRRHGGDTFVVVFAGRPDRAKGLPELLEAWDALAGDGSPMSLVLVGINPADLPSGRRAAVRAVGRQDPVSVRNFLAAADVLVLPSVPTPSFREPWGLIANEAMNQRLPIIATDAVGAAAGGLVRHERSGLVVPAGDAAALTGAIRRLRDTPEERTSLGHNGARDVLAFTHEAWGAAFGDVLAHLPGRTRRRC